MRTVLLLFVVLLSGCLDQEPTESLDAGTGSGTASGGDGGAGDGTTGAGAGGATGAGSADVAGAWEEHAVLLEGTTHTAACLPSPGGGCSGPILLDGTDDLATILGATEARVSVTLSWDDRAPGLDDLRVVLAAYTSCGDGCYAYRPLEEASGDAPVTLESEAHVLDGNETGFLLAVRDADPVVGSPVLLDAQHQRAFTLDGVAYLR